MNRIPNFLVIKAIKWAMFLYGEPSTFCMVHLARNETTSQEEFIRRVLEDLWKYRSHEERMAFMGDVLYPATVEKDQPETKTVVPGSFTRLPVENIQLTPRDPKVPLN
jgi:hypothetical protein